MNLAEFLYSILIYYFEGNVLPKECKPLIKKLNSVEDWYAKIPELKNAEKSMLSGKPVDLQGLAAALKAYVLQYQKQANSNVGFVSILKAFVTYFGKESQTGFSYLEKASTKTESAFIRAYLSTEVKVPQSETRKKLTKVVKALGYKGDKLTAEEATEARTRGFDDEKTAALYKEYLALRRDFTLVAKAFVSNYVRQSGKKTVPFKEVVKHLNAEGIEHSMSLGFTGLIDAEGNWYTVDGKLINGVPASAIFPTVKMNTTGEGDWVFQAVRADGTAGNYFYTKEAKTKNAMEKFQFTREFTKNVPKYRKRWQAFIKPKLNQEDAKEVASLVIELLYMSSHRVGSTAGGNEGGSGFGLSSILVKHVTVRDDDSILISYKGKDSVNFKLELKPQDVFQKRIVNGIKELVKGKGPREPVFTYSLKNGTQRPVTAAFIGKFFGSLTEGANIHKLRTYWGTKIFEEEVSKMYDKLKRVDAKKAMLLIKDAATKVGKKLGHVSRDAKTGQTKVNPATSLANYIDIEAQIKFFQHWEVPLPAYLARMLEQDKTITSSVIVAVVSGDGSHDSTVDLNKDGFDFEVDEEVLNMGVTKLLESYLNGYEQEAPRDTI